MQNEHAQALRIGETPVCHARRSPLTTPSDEAYARGEEAHMCWSSCGHYRFEHRDQEPRRSAGRPANDPVSTAGNLRVSDAERNRVVEALKQHAADGRLTLEEFEARVEETLSARTGTELRAVLRELPALETERRPRSRVSPGPMTLLPVAAIAVVLVGLALWHVAVWPLLIVAVVCFRATAGMRRNVSFHHDRHDRTDSDDMTFV